MARKQATRKTAPPEPRFWSKVDRRGVEECWPWTAGCFKDRGGYGAFWLNGRLWKAQRVAWLFTNGPIPEGLEVLHRCDNPQCCNPAHLWLGTSLENQRDKFEKGRHCYGERNGRAKITVQDVQEIRTLHESGVSVDELSGRYGVTPGSIYKICRRAMWPSVP